MPTLRQIGRTVNQTDRVLTIPAGGSVAEAARMMADKEVGCLVVLGNAGQVVGILTERDIITQVVSESEDPESTTVAEVMSTDLIYCSLDTSITKAQRIMTECRIRHLPILEEGVPVGIISSRDVLAHQLSAAQAFSRQQSMLLREIEKEHPGIIKLEADRSNRATA